MRRDRRRWAAQLQSTNHDFPDLPHLSAVAKRFALTTAEICANNHRPAVVNARAFVCYAARRHYGLSPTIIAKRLGVSRQSVARAFERAQRLATNIEHVVNDLLD